MPHSRGKLGITAVIWSFVPLYLCAAGPAAGGTNPQHATVYDLLSRYARAQSDNRNADAKPGDARVVRFPADKSLGRLSTQDAGAVRELTYWFHWTGNGEGIPEYLCEAQGDVRVPPGKRLILTVNEVASKNLSGLLKLKPDDLHGLRFESSPQGPPRLPPGGMKYIAHLTGLKMLDLNVRGLTHRDMEQIKALRSLEYFHASDSLTDSGLAQVAGLGALKGLYIAGKSSRVTDAGLQHVGKLTSLEELYLQGERMGDFGLLFLRNLPRLKYLCLCGSNFTDRGMLHVKEMSSLRILSFYQSLCRITDAGLLHISQMPELEILCLHWMKNITDAGMKHLSKMRSLRKLDIGSSQITDRGLAHLKQLKTLERLELPQDQKGITDAGLAHIGELPNLRSLQVSRIHFNDPKTNKEYYTDAGLAELAKCRLLGDLSLGSIGITDAGMDHVAKLTNLKSLNLFGCDNVTDAGLVKLRGLKSLTSLHITDAEITIAGLNGLNALSRLERIHVYDLRRGGAVLDFSSMPNLEDLMLYFERKSGEAFTDADLACLSGLKRLNNLQISPCNCTDKGVASLAGLIKMDRLSIGGPALTDEAIRHLTGMKKIGLLNITGGTRDKNKMSRHSGGGLTDMALRYIEEMKSLSNLRINSEHVFSAAAVQRLRKALPRLYSLDVKVARGTAERQAPQANRQTPQPLRNR